GHFPGCPLLPGGVQVTWAIEFARRYLSVAGEFRGVSGLKFMRVIQPGHPIVLQLSFAAATGQLQFEYRNASGVCASGVVLFAS
ncbi:MAG TPA: hypothetical protein VET48_03110, partial [Steroidobacteraceae bacterium]|nr:hypothetical protein [Steroidobacteraceae bacterium]